MLKMERLIVQKIKIIFMKTLVTLLVTLVMYLMVQTLGAVRAMGVGVEEIIHVKKVSCISGLVAGLLL